MKKTQRGEKMKKLNQSIQILIRFAYITVYILLYTNTIDWLRYGRGCVRMVVGFKNTCAISAYHH